MMSRRLSLASICVAVAIGATAAVGATGMVGSAGAASAAPAKLPMTKLKLINGWVSENGPFGSGNPAVSVDGSGVVHLSGSIGGGSSDSEAFALPSGDAPASTMYVDTYTLRDTLGYLIITTSGAVYPVGPDVSAYTELGGISFLSAGSDLVNSDLTLQNPVISTVWSTWPADSEVPRVPVQHSFCLPPTVRLITSSRPRTPRATPPAR